MRVWAATKLTRNWVSTRAYLVYQVSGGLPGRGFLQGLGLRGFLRRVYQKHLAGRDQISTVARFGFLAELWLPQEFRWSRQFLAGFRCLPRLGCLTAKGAHKTFYRFLPGSARSFHTNFPESAKMIFLLDKQAAMTLRGRREESEQ